MDAFENSGHQNGRVQCVTRVRAPAKLPNCTLRVQTCKASSASYEVKLDGNDLFYAARMQAHECVNLLKAYAFYTLRFLHAHADCLLISRIRAQIHGPGR